MVNTRSTITAQAQPRAPDVFPQGTALLQEAWDVVRPLMKDCTNATSADVEALEACKKRMEQFKSFSYNFLVHWTMADEIGKIIDEVKEQIEFPLPPAKRKCVC